MSLPIVVLPTDEKWDCHQCGICCRGSLVPLSDTDLERLKNQKWNEHPDFQGVRTISRIGWTNRFRLAHRRDGSCVFLNEKGLCRIHIDLGFEAKPTICRVFPLQLIPRDKNAALTIRRACPSAALDKGPPVQSHMPFIQQFVREGRLSTKANAPPYFKAGERRDWKVIRTVLDNVSKLAQDDRFPPVRRVVHMFQFAFYLQTAKTKSMPESALIELANTLAKLVREESNFFFEERKPPSWYGKILFRQIALEYARLHPCFRFQLNLRERLRMARTGWIVFRGRQLPQMSPPFSPAHFDDLEVQIKELTPAIEAPLIRHIETLSESFLYAIADRPSWNLIDSIRSLGLQYSIGLWLLRWIAHGRTPIIDDMVNIVVALDRGQGFAALAGPLQRRRLSTLGAQNDLERLAIWYV